MRVRNLLPSFSNNIICLNRTNLSTTLQNIEEAFIKKSIQIRNLKRNTKADGSPLTLITFTLISSSDRTEDII